MGQCNQCKCPISLLIQQSSRESGAISNKVLPPFLIFLLGHSGPPLLTGLVQKPWENHSPCNPGRWTRRVELMASPRSVHSSQRRPHISSCKCPLDPAHRKFICRRNWTTSPSFTFNSGTRQQLWPCLISVTEIIVGQSSSDKVGRRATTMTSMSETSHSSHSRPWWLCFGPSSSALVCICAPTLPHRCSINCLWDYLTIRCFSFVSLQFVGIVVRQPTGKRTRP